MKQFFVILVIFSFASCKKSDQRVCLKNLGKTIIELRQASAFDFIYLHDNVNLVITQDTFFSIAVEAPENLINFVKTDIDGNSLKVENNNKCDFLRSYKYKITVYVTLKQLGNIYFTGTGKISSTNVLKTPEIALNFWSASGGLDMGMDAGTININLHTGPGDITMRGSAGVCAVYSMGNGFVHLEGLESGYTFVNNSGTGDFYINVQKEMDIGIHSLGSVYYTGNPTKIRTDITGKGELRKL